MHIGHYISGVGHAGLIGWLLFGSMFDADPLPFEVTPVSVVSAEDYAALVQQQEPPVLDTDVPAPQAPTAPEEPEPTPIPPTPEPDPAPRPDPVPPAPIEPEPTPEPLPEPEPAPPVPPAPEPAPAEEPIVAPVPEPVPEVLAPKTALRPVPRPAPRVASTPVEAPEPDAVTGPETQEAATPDDTTQAELTEPEKTAPEEATTEIVTEAEEEPASAAPTRSVRPRTRPTRTAAAEPEPAPQTPSSSNAALQDALELALGGSAEPAETPSGPPLSSGERNALRLAVQDCWVVDVGSQAANVTVTLGMQMTREGRVVASSLQLLSSSGGSGAAVETAYQAARRAVLRCDQQRGGYDLPIEKYDRWKDIEMTFDPATMRLR